MGEFSTQAGELFEQFSMTMDQFDMKHAATLKQALGSYLAIGGASQAKNVQATLAPHAQAGTLQQMGSALSRGFESMKALLFSNGESAHADVQQGEQATAAVQGPTTAQARELGSQIGARELGRSLQNAIAALVGQQRTYVEPDLQKGRYSGVVLGETDQHVLLSVDGRAHTATAIEKSLLANQTYSTNKVLDVQFRNGVALGKDQGQSASLQQTARRGVSR